MRMMIRLRSDLTLFSCAGATVFVRTSLYNFEPCALAN